VGTAILILLLLVLCGFIAYMGDLLGRRLGKKRLSVFGLRPKHTAILLTVVTGVVIAAVTFGMAVISVPGFRSVVTQGERLTAQNARLDGDNRSLAAAIEQRARQNEALEARNKSIAADNTRLVTQNQTLEKGNRALGETNKTLSTKNVALQASNTTLAAKNSTLERDSTKLASSNARLAAEQGRLRSEATALKRDIRALDREIASLRKLENHLRTEQYLYRRGQQVAQRIIPANPPPDVLRSTVKAVIFEASQKVELKDAVAGHTWVKPKDYPAGRSEKIEAIQEWIATRAMQARGDDLAFRVVAAANSVADEKVLLRIDWYVNDRVFRKDEVLGSRLVDGAAEEGDILNELVFLLKTQVGPAALRKDMAPDADDTFGALTYNQLLPVCRKIKGINGFVKVVALAKQDTLRSGPLNVYLDVRVDDKSVSNLR